MEQTIEDFKKHVQKVKYESEIDDLCFTWLRLTSVDYGKNAGRAITLLDIVQDMLKEF